MKVALFTETYLPVINGVVTHVKTLKEGLESLGHKVLIVTADSRFKKHETSGDVMYCPAVRLKKIYNYDVASPLSMDRLKLIEKFNPDIIHIHNEFGIGISGVVIAKLLKVPLVYTLHTMYDDYVYYVANKHFCKFVTNATHQYARALANTAGAITGPSKKVEEYFKKCGVKKPVSVIPNSVELDAFDRGAVPPEATETLKKELGISDSDTVIGFCGRLGKEKNVTWLLEAWAKHVRPEDGIKLLIMGGGPLYEQHVGEAAALGLTDMVKFTGAIEHVELPPYYTCCDGYITASLSDTCSISMLEGMAMGLPVLHIADELNKGQVVDGVNGYIYHNAEEMYEKLKKLRDMPAADLDEFRVRVRESVKSSGSETLAKSILEIYESVIKNAILKRKLRGVHKHISLR